MSAEGTEDCDASFRNRKHKCFLEMCFELHKSCHKIGVQLNFILYTLAIIVNLSVTCWHMGLGGSWLNLLNYFIFVYFLFLLMYLDDYYLVFDYVLCS